MVLRPKEKAKADTFDSGKKKRHTLKMQVVVDEETGEFVDVSCSFPGPMADFKVLGELDLFSRLPAGIGALGDLAYVGMDELSPELAATMPRCKPRGQPREGGGPGQPSTPAQGGRLEEDRHPRRHRGDRRDGRPEGDHRGDHPRQGNLPVDVEVFAGAVRGHWAVENTCHWTLDVTFREDDSRIRERVLGANITWL